jgi:uncharacterized iron-regulated membrane protein
MSFWPVILALVIFAIVGGTLAGGVFTIVLIPLAGVALISAAAYAGWARWLEKRNETDNQRAHEPPREFSRHPRRPTGRAPSSPGGLADARRQQQ